MLACELERGSIMNEDKPDDDSRKQSGEKKWQQQFITFVS